MPINLIEVGGKEPFNLFYNTLTINSVLYKTQRNNTDTYNNRFWAENQVS